MTLTDAVRSSADDNSTLPLLPPNATPNPHEEQNLVAQTLILHSSIISPPHPFPRLLLAPRSPVSVVSPQGTLRQHSDDPDYTDVSSLFHPASSATASVHTPATSPEIGGETDQELDPNGGSESGGFDDADGEVVNWDPEVIEWEEWTYE
ncbi:hypothetical protein FRB90_002492 [Tulasnella sp. 427]|nr:hypothetical protein FRB90_002492 [Tulasnella sp. 427]